MYDFNTENESFEWTNISKVGGRPPSLLPLLPFLLCCIGTVLVKMPFKCAVLAVLSAVTGTSYCGSFLSRHRGQYST